MKIEKNKRKKWIIPVIVLAILLAGASAGAFYYMNRTQPVTDTSNDVPENARNKVNLNSPTDEQQKAGSDIKKESLENENKSENSPTQNIPIIISAANQNGNTLQIRSLIQSVLGSGTCTIELSRNDQKISKTSGVQAMSSSSTCQGFDIPVSELSPGTWTIHLTISSEGGAGSASRTVEIQ